MSFPVTYYCPRCGALVDLQREGYLDDKSVTPYPLEGWTYAAAGESFDETDGVRFVCGEAADGLSWRHPPDAEAAGDAAAASGSESIGTETAGDTAASESEPVGCGEAFYLSFLRFADGEELDPRGPTEPERVELAEGRGPQSPSGPSGPSGSTDTDDSGGGFY